jgi:hypothetical protein
LILVEGCNREGVAEGPPSPVAAVFAVVVVVVVELLLATLSVLILDF